MSTLPHNWWILIRHREQSELTSTGREKKRKKKKAQTGRRGHSEVKQKEIRGGEQGACKILSRDVNVKYNMTGREEEEFYECWHAVCRGGNMHRQSCRCSATQTSTWESCWARKRNAATHTDTHWRTLIAGCIWNTGMNRTETWRTWSPSNETGKKFRATTQTHTASPASTYWSV